MLWTGIPTYRKQTEKQKKFRLWSVYFLQDHGSYTVYCFNSNIIRYVLDWSKLKAPADDKVNVREKSKFVFRRKENIVEKGENAGISIFSYSHNVSKNVFFKVWIMCKVLVDFKKDIDCIVFNAVFQHYFCYIAAASAPIHAFLEFFLPVLLIKFFPCHLMLDFQKMSLT